MHYSITVLILLILKYVIYMCTLLSKAAYVVTSFINLYNKHSTYSLCIRRGHIVETFLKKNPVETRRRSNVDTTSCDVIQRRIDVETTSCIYRETKQIWHSYIHLIIEIKQSIILLVINSKHICYLYLVDDIFLIFFIKDLRYK